MGSDFSFHLKKNFIVSFLILSIFVWSCQSDRKHETVSNYIRVIWKIKSDDQFQIVSLQETDTITGKDSLALLIKEYSGGAKTLPSVDSVLANYENDDLYNSNLLKKTRAKIDSFKTLKSEASDNSFYLEYLKSLERLADFTKSELSELRAEKYLLKKYSKDPDEILCHVMRCQYKIKNSSSDTSSRKVIQTFYLSKDTRKILVVK